MPSNSSSSSARRMRTGGCIQGTAHLRVISGTHDTQRLEHAHTRTHATHTLCNICGQRLFVQKDEHTGTNWQQFVSFLHIAEEASQAQNHTGNGHTQPTQCTYAKEH
eukprot:1150442-Pelagomonas_calceolata.AAC.6